MDHEDGKLDHGDEAFRPVFKDEPLSLVLDFLHLLLLLWFRSSDCTETSCHCASNFCRSVHDSFSDRDLCRGYSHCGRTAECVRICRQRES